MADFFLVMTKPLLMCLILAGIHSYLGMHVLKRQIIFVDLSLAQVAALGALIGVAAGHDLDSTASYGYSLGAGFLAAVFLSSVRREQSVIPQEAIIGIVYAVSAAMAMLILSYMPEGDEHIRHMLIGNIALAETKDIVKIGLLYGTIGLFYFIFRTPMRLASENPERAARMGNALKLWDFLFYMSFALVVTSSVAVAGVLLVFSYLIMPAAIAALLAKNFRFRLIWAWSLGFAGSFTGMLISYYGNLPTGAVVVCVFGAALIAVGIIKKLTN